MVDVKDFMKLIDVVMDIAQEQATRDRSGHDWGKEKIEELLPIRDKYFDPSDVSPGPVRGNFLIDLGGDQQIYIFAPDSEVNHVRLKSTLHSELEGEDKANPTHDAAIDGMESLILACASNGVNVGGASFGQAVKDAFEAINNNHGD